MVALSTLNSRFELSIEEVYKYGLITFLMSIPELLAYICIGPIIAIFILNIWLLRNSINILM